MANPLDKIMKNKLVRDFSSRTRWAFSGLAHDFWNDGPESPFEVIRQNRHVAKWLPAKKTAAAAPQRRRPVRPSGPQIWPAMPGEIAEKMWGDGFTLPGGKALLDRMLDPLSFEKAAADKKSQLLDLTAGLGAVVNQLSADAKVHVTGLETDPALAIRANEVMMQSGKIGLDPIAYYTPDLFEPNKTVTKIYDCVIARELFYRVKDKPKFFMSLSACTRPQAQISFTDYIVNPEDLDNDAVGSWMAHEGYVQPLPLVVMAEEWAQVGFKLRASEDLSDFYRREVLLGLQRFAQFLASGMKPDGDTREAILQRLDLWTRRLAAMEQGMKFYRFYGTK